MITRELENVLNSLPEFLKMAVNAQNPLIIEMDSDDLKSNRIETVTKATWFVIPFHFMAFISLVPWNTSDTAMTVVLAMITIIFLSWVGIIIGLIHSWFRGFRSDLRERSMGGWAVTLTLCWFFCVVILSSFNLIIWLTSDGGQWPDLISELRNLLNGGPMNDLETPMLVFGVPFLSAGLTLTAFGSHRSASTGQLLMVFLTCWLITSAMVLTSLKFFAPIASVVGTS